MLKTNGPILSASATIAFAIAMAIALTMISATLWSLLAGFVR